MSVKVLFAEDVLMDAKLFSQSLPKDYEITFETDAEKVRKLISKSDFDLYVIDLHFKDQTLSGLDLLDSIRKKSPRSRPIVLTGDINTERVVKAAQKTFVHVLVKSANAHLELKNLAEQILHQREVQTAYESQSILNGKCPDLKRILNLLERLAERSSKPSLLIQGETGTGKEVIANEFSRITRRKLNVVNMAILERDRAESTLFGHIKGAFTGALSNSAGLIKQAHGGILFLDEIGECSLDVQAKLLRVIQDKQVRPMGGDSHTTVDVQFVAATHRNLKEMIRSGSFREDLYQRLSTFSVEVPPLRKRRSEILKLFYLFLNELDNPATMHCDRGAEEVLLQYPWPGNIRELKSVAERCVVFSDGRLVTRETVIEALKSSYETEASLEQSSSSNTSVETIKNVLEVEARKMIETALLKFGGNQTRTAISLGISRKHLQRMISKSGIKSFLLLPRGRPKLSRSDKNPKQASPS